MTSRLTIAFKRLASGVANDAFAAAPRPHDPVDYERPELDGSGSAAADTPVDGTKPGALLECGGCPNSMNVSTSELVG